MQDRAPCIGGNRHLPAGAAGGRDADLLLLGGKTGGERAGTGGA